MSLMSECRERCERALLDLDRYVTANRRLRMELQMALAAAIFITMRPRTGKNSPDRGTRNGRCAE
jgi:hypothetical protein